MQLSDKLKEYLINSLMRDKEELERKVCNKEDVIAQIGKYNADLAKQIEDLKYKFYQKDDECCELKKKVKRLENDKIFHVNELQKNNNAVKEVEELKKKVNELEEELLKKVIIECKPKGKPGRKPKEVKQMKQFINVGELTISAYDVLYINKDTKKVFLKDGKIIDFTGEFDPKELEEVDLTDKIFKILETAKGQSEVEIPKTGCEVDVVSTFKTCELVEELKRREGVEYNILENSDFECMIKTPFTDEAYNGPGTTILIVTD